MKNLEPYRKDIFEFFKEVVSNKNGRRNDPTYKERLGDLEDQVEELYQEYLDAVNGNSLENLSPFGFRNSEKDDLLSLYQFKSKVLQKLKIDLTTIEGRKFNTCQMCAIEPIGSFDHIVPKKDFPEYSVNPINLFPSCLNCNSIKGRRWVFDGKRMFLNLFFDVIPITQYIQVDFADYPVPEFSIISGSIDPMMEALITSHYENLELFRRYRENSNEVIDPVVTEAKALVPRIGIHEFRSVVEEAVSAMQEVYGVNHWKSLLKLSLVNHPEFESLLS